MSTVVAAVYGSATNSYQDLMDAAAIVKARMRQEPGVVDVDDTVEEDQTKYVFDVDRQKAALNGISTDDIARCLALALGSQGVGAAQVPHERKPVPIVLWPARRPLQPGRSFADLCEERDGAPGSHVGAGQLANRDRGQDDLSPQPRARGLRLGEMAGRPPVETILDLTADQADDHSQPLRGRRERSPRPLNTRTMFRKGGGIAWEVPDGVTVHWWDEGEMCITMHLFRDLGVALAGRVARHLHHSAEPDRLVPVCRSS